MPRSNKLTPRCLAASFDSQLPSPKLSLKIPLKWPLPTREDIFGSAKTDPVRFKWGFGEGLLKDRFAFFESYKHPIPKRRKRLAKRPFLYAKEALFKKPLNWTGSVFSPVSKLPPW